MPISLHGSRERLEVWKMIVCCPAHAIPAFWRSVGRAGQRFVNHDRLCRVADEKFAAEVRPR
jgi:hypothetical protein